MGGSAYAHIVLHRLKYLHLAFFTFAFPFLYHISHDLYHPCLWISPSGPCSILPLLPLLPAPLPLPLCALARLLRVAQRDVDHVRLVRALQEAGPQRARGVEVGVGSRVAGRCGCGEEESPHGSRPASPPPRAALGRRTRPSISSQEIVRREVLRYECTVLNFRAVRS